MPATLTLQREFEGQFQAVLIERRHELSDVLRLGLEHRWLDTAAIWTNGYPFLMERQAVPSYILLSASSEIVMQGNPLEDMSRIRAWLAEWRDRAPARSSSHPAPEGGSKAQLLRRIDCAIESGAYVFASEFCKRVISSKPDAETVDEVSARVTRLESPELAREVAAEKALWSARAALQEQGVTDETKSLLSDLVSEYEGTHAALTATALLQAMAPE